MNFRNGLAALLICAVSCIENNLPYPVEKIDVLHIAGEGFTSEIDAKNRVVTLLLDEPTDISRVVISEAEITEGGTASEPLTGTFDLRMPRYITLSLYQDYEWEIRAEQPIERIFTVEGQIGSTTIDTEHRTATVYVGMDADLSAIRVTGLKLGPRDITTMDPATGELTDFNSVRYVDIAYHDFRERWMLYVLRTEQTVALAQADLWNNTATLSIAAQPGASVVTLNYKKVSETSWQQAEVTAADNGFYTASIKPLWQSATNAYGFPIHTVDPATGVFAGQTYDYQLIVDDAVADEGTFETGPGETIPRGDMEEASLSCFTSDNGASDDWASGNNTFAKALCTQGSYPGMSGAACAKLTAAAPIGILAAGNLFTGVFYKDGLTKGVVEFGQPYTWKARPTAMRVKYYAEKIGTVDVDKHDGAPIGSGDQDKARIFVAIVDWNTRHKVTSGTAAPTGTWDPEQTTSTPEGRIIAYGSLFIDASSSGGQMIDVELPLNYYDKEAKPAGAYSLVISCSTSAYGDFMVGCQSNVLYVDDFRWVY